MLTWERTIDGTKICRKGRGHYLVKSVRNPKISYSVDLMANDRLGSCSCEDFTFRRLPRYQSVKARFDHFRCKHLRMIRAHIFDQILAPYAAREKE